MTVKELNENLKFNVITLPDENKEIDGVYIGDLLSWVMGRAEAGNLWVTIMSNINVIAVATLVDASAVILAEGVTLDDKVVEAADAKGINILSTEKTAYEIAGILSQLLT